MGWVKEEAVERARGRHPAQENPGEEEFQRAIARRWRKLVEEIQSDADDFNQSGGSAAFHENSDRELALGCATTGINLLLSADLEDHNIQYSYSAAGSRNAPPEGGFLTLRLSRYRCAELYSADEHLTSEEATGCCLSRCFFRRARSWPLRRWISRPFRRLDLG